MGEKWMCQFAHMLFKSLWSRHQPVWTGFVIGWWEQWNSISLNGVDLVLCWWEIYKKYNIEQVYTDTSL
jgi:hypothetical protein